MNISFNRVTIFKQKKGSRFHATPFIYLSQSPPMDSLTEFNNSLIVLLLSMLMNPINWICLHDNHKNHA